MFSRILFTALFISIINEACHAELLKGCTKFSEHQIKYSPTNEQEIVAIINSNTSTDLSVMLVGIREFSPAILLLESCEKGAKALNILNKDELKKKKHEFEEQTKHNITIDFKTLENNCKQIADIKEEIQKIIYPKQTKPTVYVHLSSKKATDKKAIKSPANGQFILLNDCTTTNGKIVNRSQILDLIQALTKEVQEAAVIEFDKGEPPCLSYLDMSTKILESLKNKYKNAKVNVLAVPTKYPDVKFGNYLVYRDGIFNQVMECTDTMRNPLQTATQLDDVLNEIAKTEISRVETELEET